MGWWEPSQGIGGASLWREAQLKGLIPFHFPMEFRCFSMRSPPNIPNNTEPKSTFIPNGSREPAPPPPDPIPKRLQGSFPRFSPHFQPQGVGRAPHQGLGWAMGGPSFPFLREWLRQARICSLRRCFSMENMPARRESQDLSRDGDKGDAEEQHLPPSLLPPSGALGCSTLGAAPPLPGFSHHSRWIRGGLFSFAVTGWEAGARRFSSFLALIRPGSSRRRRKGGSSRGRRRNSRIPAAGEAGRSHIPGGIKRQQLRAPGMGCVGSRSSAGSIPKRSQVASNTCRDGASQLSPSSQCPDQRFPLPIGSCSSSAHLSVEATFSRFLEAAPRSLHPSLQRRVLLLLSRIPGILFLWDAPSIHSLSHGNPHWDIGASDRDRGTGRAWDPAWDGGVPLV